MENALRYDEEYSKLLGYVFAIMHYGELSFMQSLEFFRIFILTLDLQSKNELDVKKYEELKEIAAEVYNIGFDRWVIYSHTIRLTNEEEQEVRSLKTELDVYRPSNSRENDREFFTKLQSLGNVIGNFIVLIKRKTPYKAQLKKYCPNYASGNIPEPINYKIRFNKVKQRAYKEALKKTENTKRRILNELRKPDIINIRNDDGQSELFSEDL
jgi:type IV secretory pathway VirB4 component